MRYFLFVLPVLFSVSLYSQSQIYSEDFTGQNGKGAVGPAPTTDLSGVDWSIDISSADLSANTDWFKVVNEVFDGNGIYGLRFGSRGEVEFEKINNFVDDIIEFNKVSSDENEFRDIVKNDWYGLEGDNYLDLNFEEELSMSYFIIVEGS